MPPTGLGTGFHKDHVDDSVSCGESRIGRIYENRSGPEDQRWFWALNAPGGRERRSSRRAGSNGGVGGDGRSAVGIAGQTTKSVQVLR
jgi:hypothetical protein